MTFLAINTTFTNPPVNILRVSTAEHEQTSSQTGSILNRSTSSRNNIKLISHTFITVIYHSVARAVIRQLVNCQVASPRIKVDIGQIVAGRVERAFVQVNSGSRAISITNYINFSTPVSDGLANRVAFTLFVHARLVWMTCAVEVFDALDVAMLA